VFLRATWDAGSYVDANFHRKRRRRGLAEEEVRDLEADRHGRGARARERQKLSAGVTTRLALPRCPSFARSTARRSADASGASADHAYDKARPPLPVDCDESMVRPIS
jgi:hypothetical protein